jgi:hypothetical protein
MQAIKFGHLGESPSNSKTNMNTERTAAPMDRGDRLFQSEPSGKPSRTRFTILKRALIGFAVIVALLAAVVAMQPADYRVTRSATLTAPPRDVFAQVNDFHNWEAWSPWAKLDPHAKATFEGPASGNGAKFAWSGNDKIGEGRQTIIESRPDELIRIKLEFERPFKDTCTSEFAFKPEDDKTVVTWSMLGHKNFIGKAVCLFMDMDKMLGGDFEKGLANMKAVVEATQGKNDAVEELKASAPPSTQSDAEKEKK